MTGGKKNLRMAGLIALFLLNRLAMGHNGSVDLKEPRPKARSESQVVRQSRHFRQPREAKDRNPLRSGQRAYDHQASGSGSERVFHSQREER
jgi:hypothetical protein